MQHGPFGEDGQVQSLLESADLVYCGAGPAASAVGMDKSLFKRVCGTLELPMLPWTEVRSAEYAADSHAVEAGLRWRGEKSEVFYGVTHLSREFQGQPTGQTVGSLRLKLRF